MKNRNNTLRPVLIAVIGILWTIEGFAQQIKADSLRNIIDVELRPNVFKKNKKPDWGTIEKEQFLKYGKGAEPFVWASAALYHYLNKNVEDFVSYKQKILRQYPSELSFYTLNNDAWFIYENAGESDPALKAALHWSKLCVESDKTSNVYLDTYAHLLYRLGRFEEALETQKSAHLLDPEDEEIAQNYRKMQADIAAQKKQ